ncbi:MAG: hypothetical protein HRT64_10395, partial [Erythrobacter sp.]|nr:hypothetical protein [Erythrobacter sp.]
RLKTALDPIFANLAFDRLQQMRDESPTGGAVGNVTERELELLASTVANVEQALDLPTFLERLDTVERKFIGTQLTALGVEPNSQEWRDTFKNEYGYSGVFEGEAPREKAQLTSGETASDQLPPEYQQAHLRYLRENWGQITPEGYASFRGNLDEQFKLTPDLRSYAEAVPGFNAAAQQGVTADQLGAVPSPQRDLGVIERGLNMSAQTMPGAAAANFGNALALGLPGAVAGQSVPLELLRDQNPVSSFAGELAGQTAGTFGVGGVAGRLGATALARPFGSEVAASAVYGATQDDNLVRGATTGALGAAGGSLVGQQIGRLFPNEIAQDALDSAYQSAPTVPQLKELANEQYAAAQAAGDAAGGEATQDMFERASNILRQESKITPTGRVSGTDTPTTEAYRLLEDYAGQTMRPQDANSVRKVLAEGRTNPDPAQRRISGMLVDEFDKWADPVLPNISEARKTAQRYMQGEQLQNLTGLGVRRGNRQKGNDVGDATRTLFGGLDEAVAKGQAYFDPRTQEAISNVAQGDATTNALRTAGKFGLGNPLTAGLTSSGVAGFAYGAGIDPVTSGVLGLGTAATGTLARNLAEKRTMNAAKVAEMSALMDQVDYEAALKAINDAAQTRAGRVGGALFGAGASRSTRSRQPLPR